MSDGQLSGEGETAGPESEETENEDEPEVSEAPPSDRDNQLSELETAALIETHNRVLDSWEASTDDDARAAAMETFAATGNVPEDAGLTQEMVDVLHEGYVYQTGVEVLDTIGITAEELGEHIAEEDLPTFRQMVLAGEWEALRNYAKAAVVLRHEAGLPLAHRRWSVKA